MTLAHSFVALGIEALMYCAGHPLEWVGMAALLVVLVASVDAWRSA